MERLSHDLNLALEESNCRRENGRRLGLRRRTRSAGNLPSAVSVSLAQDDSSSSPPQALVTQPTDSDEPHSDHTPILNSRLYCNPGNFESDSVNEVFSPTRANTRRKRKFKKNPGDCTDGTCSQTVEVSVTTEISLIPTPSSSGQPRNSSTQNVMRSNKTSYIKERSSLCGKRKWSHRGEGSEMRERSFSGGSKLSFKSYDFMKKTGGKRRKESVVQPGKIVLKSQEQADGTEMQPFAAQPGCSSSGSGGGGGGFNFVYTSGLDALAAAAAAAAPAPARTAPAAAAAAPALRHAVDDEAAGASSACAASAYCPDESSSISSSEVDSLVTNDSDREGDDELTDWPGIEELKVFNKTLTFRATKPTAQAMPPPKRLKKEKLLAKSGWASCKNRYKKKRFSLDSENENGCAMSDSATVVDAEVSIQAPPAGMLPPPNFSSFSEVKHAGAKGENANESFYMSYQAFEQKAGCQEAEMSVVQSDSTPGEPARVEVEMVEQCEPDPDSGPALRGVAAALVQARAASEVREIRAGCRRVRGARPGLLIQSALAEQLARFLRDARVRELVVCAPDARDEHRSLQDLAQLYSLDMRTEYNRIVLTKTSQTTQAVQVDHSFGTLVLDHKRRCYGSGGGGGGGSGPSIADDEPPAGSFSDSLVSRALLHPGELD